MTLAYLRIVWKGLAFLTKRNSTSQWFLMLVVFQPLIFATIAFYMFKGGGRPGSLLYAALGAGMMGIWSSTLFGGGGAISWARWEGTLELLVGTPPPFALVMLPSTLATSAIGAYSLAATLGWGRLFFGIPLHFSHPWLFALALPATVLSLGMLGLLMASSFILYRHANALMNLLEYPVWIASGLVFSVSLLPEWSRPISWALAPYWGMQAIRNAALGGEIWGPIGMATALGAVYFGLALVMVEVFERQARAKATLSLT
jgi:ABC-2 type transport system permease protein